MTSPFLEAFKVGYAIANESEAKNAKKTMFEATDEMNSLLAEMSSGAMPTDDYEKNMDRLNNLRAKWMGAASATDMTNDEFKLGLQDFSNPDAKIADMSMATMERAWGTPLAAQAAKGLLGPMNVGGNIDATFDDNGHLVVQITDRDGTKMPAMSYTQEQISQMRLTAQEGGFNSALMSEDLALKMAENDLKRAQTDNTRATADNTRAQTAGIPVEQAQESVKIAAEIDKASADAETSRINAETAAAREAREAAVAAAAPSKERDAAFAEMVASVDSQDFTDALGPAPAGEFGEMFSEDPSRAKALVQNIMQGAYQHGRVLTPSEAAALAGANVLPHEAAAAIKRSPGASIDQIIAMLEGG